MSKKTIRDTSETKAGETKAGKRKAVDASSHREEFVQEQEVVRRHLLGLGVPAAASLLLAACGGAMFGGSKTKGSKKSATNEVGPGEDKPRPASDEGGGASPSPTPGANTSSVSGPVMREPCKQTGVGEIKLPPLGSPPSLSANMKGYGDELDGMVVVKATGLQAGDVLFLVSKIDESKGAILARRKINGVDISQGGVIIFDGLALGAGSTLTTVLYRHEGNAIKEQLRGKDVPVASLWQRQVTVGEGSGIAAGTYHVIDVFSIRGAMGYALKGDHPNYWDGSNLTVCMAFGAPSSSQAFGKQGPKGIPTRDYVQAKSDATWAAPAMPYVPATYCVCNAFGDVLLPGGFAAAGAGAILKVHSTLMVYVYDPAGGGHIHRYFFHIG
jgi:hypothetical protein